LPHHGKSSADFGPNLSRIQPAMGQICKPQFSLLAIGFLHH